RGGDFFEPFPSGLLDAGESVLHRLGGAGSWITKLDDLFTGFGGAGSELFRRLETTAHGEPKTLDLASGPIRRGTDRVFELRPAQGPTMTSDAHQLVEILDRAHVSGDRPAGTGQEILQSPKFLFGDHGPENPFPFGRGKGVEQLFGLVDGFVDGVAVVDDLVYHEPDRACYCDQGMRFERIQGDPYPADSDGCPAHLRIDHRRKPGDSGTYEVAGELGRLPKVGDRCDRRVDVFGDPFEMPLQSREELRIREVLHRRFHPGRQVVDPFD